jgi:prepilin-type N-terminal cleavage/methylation domain-containing protein
MKKSFTLIELMIVVAIIAIIAAIAIPGLLRARISSNETSAIGSLRSTSTGQSQFQNATVKDRDLDGVGEYGYYTEMAGIAPCPVGTSAGTPAKPSFCTSVFGTTSSSSTGLANKSGYNFRMFLPGGATAGVPIPESGAATAPVTTVTDEINAQETRWCTYSWPTSSGNSGNKAFFVNQSGEVIATSNIPVGATALFYSGATTTPVATEIFDTDGTGDIDGTLLTGTPTAVSGCVWNPTN